MANTPSFNWETPDDTDYVTDGAAAIRTLGNSIDASMTDLKGGTTGQVLSKASGTDMDFTWVAQDDSNAIQNALLTTTGDTIYASGASTPARLGIGTTGQVLTVAGGVPTWATASAGGMTLISTVNASAATGVSFTSIAGTYKHLLVVWEQVYQSAFNGFFTVRLNNNSTSSYTYAGVRYRNDTAYPGQNWEENQTKFGSGNDFAPIMATDTSSNQGENSYGRMWIYDYAQSSTGIGIEWSSHSKNPSDGFNNMALATGYWQPSTLAAVTQIDFVRSSTQTLTGTFKLYGVS